MNIREMITKMTLEEKAGLLSGANSWDTEKIERLGLPKITMSDGPHGLRRQDNYENHGMDETASAAQRSGATAVTTRKAVGWPTASALAASFDRELMHELGGVLGEECLANDTQVLLGPGVNIKRSPLCGRNFEYFSEDPYLAGELAAEYVSGLQEKGVSACVKHFAANNQEFRRMTNNSVVDERSLREIYLPAFEAAVKKGGAKSLMCSYNLINGVYACENLWLLTDVLRTEWGFEGIVMTDWGAMDDRVEALKAGLELEMPSSGGLNDQKIVEAVKCGELEEAVLDRAVERLLTWIDWCLQHRKAFPLRLEQDHRKAAEIAEKCAVLLKNEGCTLPLRKEQKVVFLGSYAENPRIQGGGSSHINNYRIDSALSQAAENPNICYCPMFRDEESCGEEEWQTALRAAKEADVAVIFAGLPDTYESEGFDRKHLEMPPVQVRAIREVAAVQPNTVVLLHIGSPVAMPWLDKVKAVLNLYLSGEGAGTAALRLLYGDASPSGRLAETFPLRLEDSPSYPDYGKSKTEAVYREGIYVGYRHYDARKLDVLFPFGFGLSYTSFSMKNLRLNRNSLCQGETVNASVEVTNTGDRTGTETVQLYVGFDGVDRVGRAPRELRGFQKVTLAPGESKTVVIPLDLRAFSYYETRIHDWYAEGGQYSVYVGSSSRDLPLRATITVENRTLPLGGYQRVTLGDLLDKARTPEEEQRIFALGGHLSKRVSDLSGDEDARKMIRSVLDGLPLHSVKSFSRTPEDEIRAVYEEFRDR